LNARSSNLELCPRTFGTTGTFGTIGTVLRVENRGRVTPGSHIPRGLKKGIRKILTGTFLGPSKPTADSGDGTPNYKCPFFGLLTIGTTGTERSSGTFGTILFLLLTCLLMGDRDLSLEEPELELILALILQSVIDLDMTVTYG
jgi:hypothetical protein